MGYRQEYTHIVGLMRQKAKTHGATYYRDHWSTVCGISLADSDVVECGTCEDEGDVELSCKRCCKLLRLDLEVAR